MTTRHQFIYYMLRVKTAAAAGSDNSNTQALNCPSNYQTHCPMAYYVRARKVGNIYRYMLVMLISNFLLIRMTNL